MCCFTDFFAKRRNTKSITSVWPPKSKKQGLAQREGYSLREDLSLRHWWASSPMAYAQMRTLRLRRMVRIHFRCAKKKGSIQPEWVKLNLLAQREGFEPSCAFGTNWFRVSPVMTTSIPLRKKQILRKDSYIISQLLRKINSYTKFFLFFSIFFDYKCFTSSIFGTINFNSTLRFSEIVDKKGFL